MKHLLLAGGLGFLLGMRHAMDADHLVAVSTIVSRTRKLGASWLLGALWGLGHTLTIFLVGSVIILLKWQIPTRLGLAMEFSVGLVLVALGLLNLKSLRFAGLAANAHSHEHSHEGGHGHHLPHSRGAGESHEHVHEHPPAMDWLERAAEAAGAGRMLRSFLVGLVHGLAGSAAVALLVLATIPGVWGGVVYLLVFGAGTLAGMVCFSTVLELSVFWMNAKFAAERWILSGTGLLSLAFGLYVVYQIGWIDGLFLKTAHWDPR